MSPQPSGEKTERATPRKRRLARENAQVLKSTELITAISLLVLFGTASIFGGYIIGNLKKLMVDYFDPGGSLPEMLDTASATAYLRFALMKIGLIIAPLLAAALLAGLLSNYIQIGFLFTPKALQPKMSRINMAEGFKRIFSTQSLVQLIKSGVKIVLLGYIAYREYRAQMAGFPNLMWFNIPDASVFIAELLLKVAFKMCIAFAILAPIDYFYEWWKREKELMMTKQEVLDEYKLTEGNPQIKGRIRQKQRQISGMRMMQAIPEADVVVVNPTHYAVALVYDEKKNDAPQVIAKGKGYLAKKIRETAKETEIEIVENKELAQALYFYCEVGDEVPEELYQAVAEILAYVYRLKNKLGGERD